jgi:hypothetical protein
MEARDIGFVVPRVLHVPVMMVPPGRLPGSLDRLELVSQTYNTQTWCLQ